MVNKVIAMYLCCVTIDRPRAWVDWLSWVEYCYNTSFHSAPCSTPFEVVYGRPPPPLVVYRARLARIDTSMFFFGTAMRRWTEIRERLVQVLQLSTTPPIVTWSLQWGTGFGCAFLINTPVLGASGQG